MWPDRVSNPGPLIYESGALPTALRGPAKLQILSVLQYYNWKDLCVDFIEDKLCCSKLYGVCYSMLNSHDAL